MKLKSASLPYAVWSFIFVVVPLGMVAYFAFIDQNGHFTLENVSSVGQYTPVLARSIWLAAIATIVCLIIAYPLSYLLSRMHAGRQKVFLMLVMLPMWMNFLLRTYAWMTL